MEWAANACAWNNQGDDVSRASIREYHPELGPPSISVVTPCNRRPCQMQVFLTSGHCYIEQSAFIFHGSLVTKLILDSIFRNQVPNISPSDFRSRESVAEQGRHEHHGPLHALGLMHRHDLHRIRIRVLIVLPTFRIGIFSPMAEEIRECFIFLYRFRVIVNGLEVRNDLAEFPKIIEDDFASVAGIRSSRMPDFSRKLINTRWMEYWPNVSGRDRSARPWPLRDPG